MITSKSNELIKHVKCLHQKKYRDEFKEFFVEGIKLVEEAIIEKMQIVKIIICEEFLREEFNFKGFEIEYVNANVFEFISDTKSPQGILAVIRMPEFTEDLGGTVFALDNLQDPGNLGTIIRIKRSKL